MATATTFTVKPYNTSCEKTVNGTKKSNELIYSPNPYILKDEV